MTKIIPVFSIEPNNWKYAVMTCRPMKAIATLTSHGARRRSPTCACNRQNRNSAGAAIQCGPVVPVPVVPDLVLHQQPHPREAEHTGLGRRPCPAPLPVGNEPGFDGAGGEQERRERRADGADGQCRSRDLGEAVEVAEASGYDATSSIRMPNPSVEGPNSGTRDRCNSIPSPESVTPTMT